MDCRETFEKLSAFYDGELSPDESWTIEEHLIECASCRRALAEIKGVDMRLSELPGVEASESFDEQLARRMRKSGVMYRLLKSHVVQLAVAASVVIVVGVAALSWSRAHTTGPEPFNVQTDLPNLSLLDDGGFLGVQSYNAGIGDGLEVGFALTDSPADAGLENKEN